MCVLLVTHLLRLVGRLGTRQPVKSGGRLSWNFQQVKQISISFHAPVGGRGFKHIRCSELALV